MSTFRKIKKQIGYLYIRYVLCRGDNIRFLRWRGAKIGEKCQITGSVLRFGTEPWLIEIGNRVSLTGGVALITHDGSSRLFRDRLPGSSKYGNRFGKIVIHDNCFVGMNSIVLPGITIGPNSIIGTGSVVTKDVPPSTVVAGVPARKLCTLDEYIEKYKQKVIPIQANNRDDLRRELTLYFWGEER